MIDLNELNAALTEYDASLKHTSEIKFAIQKLKGHPATVAALCICYDEAFQATMVKVQKVQSFGVSVIEAYAFVKELRAA